MHRFFVPEENRTENEIVIHGDDDKPYPQCSQDGKRGKDNGFLWERCGL